MNANDSILAGGAWQYSRNVHAVSGQVIAMVAPADFGLQICCWAGAQPFIVLSGRIACVRFRFMAILVPGA